VRGSAAAMETIYTRKEQFTKELRARKPKYSPSIDKWLSGEFGGIGKISIAQNGVWTYYDWEGNYVSYPDGYPDFRNAQKNK